MVIPRTYDGIKFIRGEIGLGFDVEKKLKISLKENLEMNICGEFLVYFWWYVF